MGSTSFLSTSSARHSIGFLFGGDHDGYQSAIDKQLLPQYLADEPSIVLGYLLNWGKCMLAWVLSYTAYHYV
jgi:hypothetical protein